MRINTQFPVAVHIMTFVGLSQLVERDMPKSAAIAKSVNTNPVVVRRINGMLKEAGLIHVRAGVGGVEILKDPKDITLRDIFLAVKAAGSPSIFNLHQNTNPKCPIGSVINSVISSPLEEAQKALEEKLADTSLYDLMSDVAGRNKVDLSNY